MKGTEADKKQQQVAQTFHDTNFDSGEISI
jgi:hypothetical protein